MDFSQILRPKADPNTLFNKKILHSCPVGRACSRSAVLMQASLRSRLIAALPLEGGSKFFTLHSSLFTPKGALRLLYRCAAVAAVTLLAAATRSQEGGSLLQGGDEVQVGRDEFTGGTGT